ncbi:FAD binding domain protein [Pleurostoma richardsiae]|uniref:FAD binding domain protein n=1 Tax=Pleurostoma richardsiae TaxID=41990 RepID=A0AA38RFD2_9PEZI|nr:FAD binding domain protein [Pleurostoma richardsiae]
MAVGKPLKVIIVGAGFGGLGAAIECAQRGMDVTIVEKYPDSNNQGDILDFFANAGCIINRWDDGKVGQLIHDSGCSRIRAMELCKFDGKFLTNVPWARDEREHSITYAGHRGKIHSIFLEYTKTLVKDTRIGVAAVEYKEEEDRAGVVLSNGETVWGDCVIAADGPRSIARKQVLHLNDEEKNGNSSGWAVFRSFFKTSEEARSHPDLQHLFHSDRDTVRFWMCDNLSMMLFVWNQGKDIAWVLIHPDDKESTESWSNVAEREHVEKWVNYFTAKDARALFDVTPVGRTIDFKLVYRPAIDKWTSEGGRTILIGDAAHANLPTAGQGASQALEDAVTVAHCLEQSGGDVKLALEAAQRIRYHRSNAVHRSGQVNRDAFYKIPWDTIEADPELWAKKRFPKLKPWDPLHFAREQFPKVTEDIRKGVTGSLDDVAVPPLAGGYW